MKQIELQIKALSPLAISRQKPRGSISEAMDYIPGSVIRGAIAAKILQESGHYSSDFSHNGGDFQSLFLGENPAIFRNAYPASLKFDDESNEIEIQSDIRVLPATALSSKNNSGFKPQKNGVFDTLIDRFCAERYGYIYEPNCPEDGYRVEPFSGFYSVFNEEYYSHSISKRLLTRVGINRRRSTAEDQILYSIEVLNESKEKKDNPIVYSGSILIEDSQLANSLKQFIEQRCHDFRIGGSMSRGLGKVEITARQPFEVSLKIEGRIQKFNRKLRKRWQTWQVFNDTQADLSDEKTYFTLDLQSDAILTEQWRRTTVISPEMLKQLLNIEDSSLQLHTVYSSYDYLSGWNTAWGLMKDVELITNKGAVYFFSTTQLNSWLQPLEDLEKTGIGDRTCEGFGQVRVCDEFHLILREEAV
ncbi:CRISPR-associated RAMP protein Csx10 [Aphanothece hegewaldii CCALA 016]|uniref:CRISPR-associated RAMP protein Csx10 n=1 Tax=Aphanothece hegewaldii CCALA 016 TaxID=2107694 RepID=A0A2T1LYI0_9CHRO|nr:CRISPR-associated RAMP protein Csx10 [Aphanothece hegewaldii]PSF37382.1 CRISPR-associated RAMP protein Csx10 [Aphanothece hegewaldii CCALA 016]